MNSASGMTQPTEFARSRAAIDTIPNGIIVSTSKEVFYMTLMKRLEMFSTAILLRLRFWRICKLLGIKPYPWQKAFALGKIDSLDAPPGRQTGKTMAVMLKLLLFSYNFPPAALFPVSVAEEIFLNILRCNSDFVQCSHERVRFYAREYEHLCEKAAILPCVDIRNLYRHPRHMNHVF